MMCEPNCNVTILSQDIVYCFPLSCFPGSGACNNVTIHIITLWFGLSNWLIIFFGKIHSWLDIFLRDMNKFLPLVTNNWTVNVAIEQEDLLLIWIVSADSLNYLRSQEQKDPVNFLHVHIQDNWLNEPTIDFWIHWQWYLIINNNFNIFLIVWKKLQSHFFCMILHILQVFFFLSYSLRYINGTKLQHISFKWKK